MFDDLDKIFWKAKKGLLPSDFKDWDLQDINGASIAHIVVNRGHKLPDDFDMWAMLDNNGTTVAHAAVLSKNLPTKIDNWNKMGVWRLRNVAGWTVAHFAARAGLLPKNFDQWDLETNGITVAHALAETGKLPDDVFARRLVNKNGQTVIDVYQNALASKAFEYRILAFFFIGLSFFIAVPFLVQN